MAQHCASGIIFYGLIMLHHVWLWLSAVHPWLNAIRHQYLGQCCASGINMAVHYAHIWLNAVAVHHALKWLNLAQYFPSCIHMALYYASCSKIMAPMAHDQCSSSTADWCASGINSICSSMLCIRHQCGCASCQYGSILHVHPRHKDVHQASVWCNTLKWLNLAQ